MFKTYAETVKDPINQPADYDSLSEKEKAVLQKWIDERIRPHIGERYNNSFSSYTLKHLFRNNIGLYVSNGAFKGAMLEAGILPKNQEDLNWVFKIRGFNKVARELREAGIQYKVFDDC